MSPTVLVVDDDPQLLRVLVAGLEANGFELAVATNGEEALQSCGTHLPDIVVLDLMMPRMDGTEFLRHFRVWSQVPVIVLSVHGDEERKIEALDLGANDYLTKPFGLGELMARIRATLRSVQSRDVPAANVEIGDLRIDLGARAVSRSTKPIHLTPTEFDLLAYLVRHEGRVLTHRLILSAVWGPKYEDETPSLRVMIRQLRKKIEEDPEHPRLVLTEPGVGYRFRS